MINLSLNETRVLGVLLEKEVLTPDQYPLSLNALVNACNQKSSRDPVLELSQSIVVETIDELVKKHLLSEVVYGSRVPKYKHRFCNTEFSEYHFSKQELGLVCCLLLRGPQTPGELRTRTARLCSFSDVSEVDAILLRLMDRNDGPFVARMAKEPGRREQRYAHLFSGEVSSFELSGGPAGIESTATGADIDKNSENDRITLLEEKVEELQAKIEYLQQQWNELNS